MLSKDASSTIFFNLWYESPRPLANTYIYLILYFLCEIEPCDKNKSKVGDHNQGQLKGSLLLWTPTYECAKAGRPARTYIQQLCEDTGCNPEDLPEAMNDREKWRERVRDIRTGGTTWWWWWWCQGVVEGAISFCR